MIAGTCSSCGAETNVCDGCFNCNASSCGCQCDKVMENDADESDGIEDV